MIDQVQMDVRAMHDCDRIEDVGQYGLYIGGNALPTAEGSEKDMLEVVDFCIERSKGICIKKPLG